MAWELWRQDDHGNEFLVRAFGDRAAADAERDVFEARGHHQHYWVAERPGDVAVRPLDVGERPWLWEVLAGRWGGEEVHGRGRSWRPGELDALVAVERGERIGVATFVVEGEEADLVTLDALAPGRGAGRALIDAVAAAAHETGASRLRATTTNDNLRALRLYQRAGFRLEALRAGGVDGARARKQSIPATGADGIPIRDELDLVLDLTTRERSLLLVRSHRYGARAARTRSRWLLLTRSERSLASPPGAVDVQRPAQLGRVRASPGGDPARAGDPRTRRRAPGSAPSAGRRAARSRRGRGPVRARSRACRSRP